MSYTIKMPEITCYPALRNAGITREYIKKIGNPSVKRKIIVLKNKTKWVFDEEAVWCVLYEDYDLYVKRQTINR